jgi:hypothetical protein
MVIKFHHPPTGTANPFLTFDPSNIAQYPNGNGIYIYGLRLDVIERGVINKKFVPLYVGIGDLFNRLFNHHYNNYNSLGTGIKDLWDFSAGVFTKYDIYSRYADMLYYDYINNYRTGMGGGYRSSLEYMNELNEIKSLLFFQNINYFNVKFGLGFNPDPIIPNVNQLNVVPFFGLNPSLIKIQNTKLKYDSDFYFVYASLNNPEHIRVCPTDKLTPQYNTAIEGGDFNAFLEPLEKASKKALNKIGIHTTAKAQGILCDTDIDLSDIQNDLINICVHTCGEPYVNPLIVSIP